MTLSLLITYLFPAFEPQGITKPISACVVLCGWEHSPKPFSISSLNHSSTTIPNLIEALSLSEQKTTFSSSYHLPYTHPGTQSQLNHSAQQLLSNLPLKLKEHPLKSQTGSATWRSHVEAIFHLLSLDLSSGGPLPQSWC